jgi:hypothetical protein
MWHVLLQSYTIPEEVRHTKGAYNGTSRRSCLSKRAGSAAKQCKQRNTKSTSRSRQTSQAQPGAKQRVTPAHIACSTMRGLAGTVPVSPATACLLKQASGGQRPTPSQTQYSDKIFKEKHMSYLYTPKRESHLHTSPSEGIAALPAAPWCTQAAISRAAALEHSERKHRSCMWSPSQPCTIKPNMLQHTPGSQTQPATLPANPCTESMVSQRCP